MRAELLNHSNWPYEEDLIPLGLKSKESIEKCMVRMWSKDKLPTFTKTYEVLQRGEWCSVLELYQMTAKVNPSSRPRIGDLHVHRNLGDGSGMGDISMNVGNGSVVGEIMKNVGKGSGVGEISKSVGNGIF